MKVERNTFTQGLRSNQKQIGLWASLCSNYAAEVIAPSGYDWVLLDMEHSPNSIDGVLGQLEVFASSKTTAIVRPPWNDSVIVKRLLDIGAPGLLFPMIQTVDEAEQAVASTRYPPRGIRGVSGATRANAFGRMTDYFSRIEDETSVLIQLETRTALADALNIASVDGVSGVFFGPADIAADIGQLGKPLCDEVWDLVMPVARQLMENGIPVGTLVMDVEFAAKLLNEGFSFVACGSDVGLLAKSADSLLANVKQRVE
ncbi:MAG: 4-hydroxy-2-oxoheptanedioate aldolase [Gammaproteobacteria bacterium]|jgi:4-hydroxy-2-oxoheptanedioate aldolase